MTSAELIALARSSADRFTILGGSGFIGTQLAKFFQQNEIAFVSPPRDDSSVFNEPLGHVIYAIGLTADYAKRPFETVEAHVGYLAKILRSSRFTSLVYLSSTRLYDSSGPHGKEDDPLSLHPTNPRHIFDLSKALGEALCIRTNERARVARLSSVYADDLSGTNFLHDIVRTAANPAVSTIDTQPNLLRDYINVEDVIPLLLAIALKGRRPIYNVASGENISNEEILQQLGTITKHFVRPTRVAITGHAPLISIDAIVEDFSFRPRSLSENLPALLARARS